MEKVKYNTFAVMFYINKGRIKKNGTTTVMGRISVSGEMVQFSTKIDINPTLWDAKRYRLKGRERESIEINSQLQELTDAITGYYKDFIKQQGYVTAELLKNRVCNIGQKTDMLLELFREHNEQYKQMVGVNREEKSFLMYHYAINHISDFVKAQYDTEDIELTRLNLRFLEDMMLFLRGEKGLSVNTANGVAISLKRVIKCAINQGTLRKNPFVGYKFDVVPPECRHQIEEDLHKLMTTEIKSKALCFSRDMFIFSTFTGTSFSDVVKLTDKNIGINNKGDKHLTFKRQKTGTECYVPLLDIPLKIIEKYRRERKSERLFNMTTWSTMYENLGKMQKLCSLKEPISCNQKMNDYLKELGELAEINDPVRETYYKGNERIDTVTPKYALLGTHAGRRTFICNALALGILAQVVMKWTGHSDYKAMKPYIDVADDIKANAMNKFNQL